MHQVASFERRAKSEDWEGHFINYSEVLGQPSLLIILPQSLDAIFKLTIIFDQQDRGVHCTLCGHKTLKSTSPAHLKEHYWGRPTCVELKFSLWSETIKQQNKKDFTLPNHHQETPRGVQVQAGKGGLHLDFLFIKVEAD